MSTYLDTRNQAVTLDYDQLNVTCPAILSGGLNLSAAAGQPLETINPTSSQDYNVFVLAATLQPSISTSLWTLPLVNSSVYLVKTDLVTLASDGSTPLSFNQCDYITISNVGAPTISLGYSYSFSGNNGALTIAYTTTLTTITLHLVTGPRVTKATFKSEIFRCSMV